MPDLVRWPQFQKGFVSESEIKIHELVYVVDSHSVTQRGLQQLAIEAFSSSLSQSEARLLIMMLIHKDNLQIKKRQTQMDNKNNTLRFDNDWDLKEDDNEPV